MVDKYFTTKGLVKGRYFNPPQYCACKACLHCSRNRQQGLCNYQIRVGDNTICDDCRDWNCNPNIKAMISR